MVSVILSSSHHTDVCFLLFDAIKKRFHVMIDDWPLSRLCGQNRKMAALVSRIFWLHFCAAVGGRGDMLSVFLNVNNACINVLMCVLQVVSLTARRVPVIQCFSGWMRSRTSERTDQRLTHTLVRRLHVMMIIFMVFYWWFIKNWGVLYGLARQNNSQHSL